MPLVWQMPDGSLQVTTFAEPFLKRERRPGESTEDAVLRLAPYIQSKTPSLAGGIPKLVKSGDLPPDRSQRHKWRLRASQVVVDPTVPEKPHPRKGLLDDIDKANSIPELKALLKRLAG